jgi:predicted transcriptional regulator
MLCCALLPSSIRTGAFEIRVLHKGGETSDKLSEWRPIGLLNVGTQLVHHVINYRLTTIKEVENLIVPGQDGGRAGRVSI